MALKISVITVSFNQGKYIEENILSVLNQGYENFEHIIIDACSTDGTIDILKKYPHLVWTSEPDRGQSDGLNKGFRKATGDLIVWLNSDDLMCDGAFNALNDFFSRNPDKHVVTGRQVYIDENGQELRTVESETYSYNRLLNTRHCSVMQNSTVFRKSVLDNVGLLDESLHYTMDLDLFIRIAKNYTWYSIDSNIAKFRFQPESKTCTSKLGFFRNIRTIRKKYNAPFSFKMRFWIEWQFIKEPFRGNKFLKKYIAPLIKF